ncbi:DUF2057 domain-containing protein [Acinetobacter sp. UBA801]|uniref:DUF2057 domain-containing protein n=1 Tax=unclassified Acinetobacter TaxID=196816 RepID=UPI0025B7C2E6|nr:DUF2057 domain-containing protein [Acinetobacter sp. UBA801]
MAFKLGVAAIALMASSSAFSAVTISVPEEIKLLAVNDQEIRSGLFSSAQQVKVNAGENVINLRYQQYFEHHNGAHDILKSGVITLKTPILQDGENYRLALVNPPKDFDAAKEFKDQPSIGLYNQKNQLLVQQTGAKASSTGWLIGSLRNKTVDTTQNSATVNQPAAVYTAAAVLPSEKTTSVTLHTQKQTQGKEQQLIQLWQQASKAERQKFMSWLAEQVN